jgi:glycosyltransferase involved in cell wall biosynthesis
MDQPRVLTWHVHGSYMYYLSKSNAQFYLPIDDNRPDGYGRIASNFDWGDNVHEVPVEQVRNLELDGILFQSRKQYLEDQYEILSAQQRELPKIYLEHDPPREHPTDTRHIVDDPDMLLVHVTAFNQLMWDNNRTPTRFIDHGVVEPKDVRYTGELPRGLVVINNLQSRGRRLGLDVFEYVRQQIPLDLIGMNSEELGGQGPIDLSEVPEFASHYRFFFNPIRYTSLGLAVCEAMMLGMPVVGLATTEMVTTIENGVNGYVDTNIDRLIQSMQALLDDIDLARKLGAGARYTASQRFNIRRFADDWDETFREFFRQKARIPVYVENNPKGMS